MGLTLHNPREVLLGTVGVSDAEVSNEIGDPKDFPAGLAVRAGSNGSLSLSEGDLLGVSLGRSLYDSERTAVARVGQKVPLQLTDEGTLASGTIEITDFANLDGDTVEVAGVEFIAQTSASNPGESKFTAATSDADTASSLADQINAHPEASKFVLAEPDGAEVNITSKVKGEAGNDISLVYTPTSTPGATVSGSGTLENGTEPYDYVVEGAPVEIDLSTGKAVSDGQATGAIYCHSGHKIGIVPGFYGQIDVAQIDMIGGL